jgi:predicted nucleic acid-binding protein
VVANALDTSALLKRFVEEPGSDAVIELLADPVFRGRLFLAHHTEPEVVSALNERYRRTELSHRDVEKLVAQFRRIEGTFALVPLDPAVLNDATFVLNLHRTTAIHAGDAFHIAVVRYAARTMLLNERVVLVSADRSMLRSARRLGIEVHNPEQDSLSLLRT